MDIVYAIGKFSLCRSHLSCSSTIQRMFQKVVVIDRWRMLSSMILERFVRIAKFFTTY